MHCPLRPFLTSIALFQWAFHASGLASESGEIVLFDAALTPPSAVSSRPGAELSTRDGVLRIETKAGTGYPGVIIRGSWDLSTCNRLTVELANLDAKGELPLTVRLDNSDADPAKGVGVFLDRVKVSGKSAKPYDLALPPSLANVREINAKLFGMRKGPLATTGIVAALDAAKVVAATVYINEPKLDWKWGIKRIVAHQGPFAEAPAWMRLSASEFFPFIDRYGQFKYKEWPGKIHNDGELKRTWEKEAADLAAHPGPEGWDKYGGWAAGPKQKATGHFRTEKLNGKWWLIDPDGYLYWSHGPVRVTSSSAVTPLDGRECYFTDLPDANSPFALFYTTHDALLWPYYVARGIQRTYDFSSANAYRKYGENWAPQYADIAHRRLRSWGLNTIANSSDARICQLRRTPYCDRFELKSPDIEGSHLGWWKFRDPFHPEFRAGFRRQLLARKAELDDPWCIGFFVDNEISWGGPTDLAKWALQSPATQPVKMELLVRLKTKYGNIAELNSVWGSSFTTWDALLSSQEPPPPKASEDCAELTAYVTEEYFKRIRDEFKAVAPDALYLGCRFAGSTEAAVRLAAKYCDVVSYNIYRHTLDSFKLPEGVDMPILVGEFHFGALDRGLFHNSLIGVPDQEARGQAYAAYITSALRHSNFVGAHWHQFGDQPTTGRFDGENFQNGFVDVCDTPYPETIAKIREVGYKMYEIRSQP